MLPLDVDSLVADFDLASQYGSLVIERRAAPTLGTGGVFTSPAPTLMHVRPWTAHTASGREILEVPEADRNKEATVFYVQNIPIYVADGNRQADVFRYQDRRWVASVVHRYGAQGRVWFAVCVLADTQEDA
jgi:hypothetical protein